jgi:beta-mannosidase
MQLNDVYPATSWAYVDYYLRPKPAFYIIRRAFAPISLGIDRTPKTKWVDEDRPELTAQPPRFAFFAHNTRSTEASLTLKVQVYDFKNRTYLRLRPEDATRRVLLEAGCNTELGEMLLADVPPSSELVVCATLVKSNGAFVARHVDWPEPYRYLTWPSDTKVIHKIIPSSCKEWEQEVEILANVPVKGYWLEQMSTAGKEPKWEDNMLDLMPDETIVVGVTGLDGSMLQARFLADWEIVVDKPTKSNINTMVSKL